MSLSIENVTKKFNQTLALDHINVSIKDSEFIAILGPSGCGKTTLLRTIGGFIQPTSGTIRMDGVVCSDAKTMIPVEQRNLGMVFQSFALWPHMTVRQHVEFPMKSKRQKHISAQEKEKMVDYALKCTGLTALENRLPGELSGGQRQRVALARAIVGKPSVLLMDEPLSALDAELKISMRKEIQDIHKMTGATIVYVTHDQSEAMAMADRIIIMKDGKIEQIGTPKEIYCHPATRFVSTFVSKCNLIKGRWNGDYFQVLNEPIRYHDGEIAPVFHQEGLYPVRPEEIRLVTQGEGIPGVITNKQYNGREIHYSVQYGEDNFTVYTSANEEYEPGQNIKMVIERREAV